MILNFSWLKLSSQAARSHSCRSSSDLFAEALALSCFYKSAYLLFDMIGFEKCLWTVKSWKQYTIQRQQLKRQNNSKAILQICAEFTYFPNFEKRTFVNEKFAPQKNKLWQFVQLSTEVFASAAGEFKGGAVVQITYKLQCWSLHFAHL